MVHTIFNREYDDKEDPRCRGYLERWTRNAKFYLDKGGQWAKDAALTAYQTIARSPFAYALVEGQGDGGRNGMILEYWQGENRKGEVKMSSLDKEVSEAFSQPYKRPEGSAGTKTLSEAEIDAALDIERKGKVDSNIDEAISEAFSV